MTFVHYISVVPLRSNKAVPWIGPMHISLRMLSFAASVLPCIPLRPSSHSFHMTAASDKFR
jgi:hypothetical protein